LSAFQKNLKMIDEIKKVLTFFVIMMMIWMLPGCHQDKNEIQKAINLQLTRYPESALQDIYKSFFQDEFGPGHLLEDTSWAREYFDLELEEITSSSLHSAEPCGAGKNFYRVPLDLVLDEIIPADTIFAAFLESAALFRTPNISEWKEKWGQILGVIESMDLKIRNFERDKLAISQMLDRGETAVHHSQAYTVRYNPHYRIIGKQQWEQLRTKYHLAKD
jgi:hypothetical protein